MFSAIVLGERPARLHPFPERRHGFHHCHAFTGQDATDNFAGQLAGQCRSFHLGDASLLHDCDGQVPVGLFGGDRPALTSGSF